MTYNYLPIQLTFFSSSATPSVPSQTVNLKTLTTENTSLTYESVCDVVSTHFYHCHHLDHNKVGIIIIYFNSYCPSTFRRRKTFPLKGGLMIEHVFLMP